MSKPHTATTLGFLVDQGKLDWDDSVDRHLPEFSQLKLAANGLNVIWVTDALSRADTLALMKSLDVYVSLHRSEGFGLTMAEAMAIGKPVVASAYSGNVDFMTMSDTCLVRTPVITTDRDHGPYPAGTHWGDPDVEQAAAYLVALMNAETRSRIGSAASRCIRERLNPLEVGRGVAGFIGSPES